ncbi:MAG: hypothetical protein JJE36_04745 [Coriobacteriia bacterium]|nr:hypothetical protein [Coriobacteriia bacterium]
MVGKTTAAAGASRRLKAAAVASAQRERINLVNTTFFTSSSTRVNPITGEILPLPTIPPVSIGFIEYPDGGCELFGVRRITNKSTSAYLDTEELRHEAEEKSYGNKEAERRAEERTEVNKARSTQMACRRAKTKVRRICRYYGLSVMVTLTFPGKGVHDYDEALHYVQKFINDHGSALYLDGVYVAVPELHPKGHGWHWHVLVHRRFTLEEKEWLDWQWTLFLERKGMKVSGGAKFVRINLKDFKNARSGAAYASKYIGKTFDSDERLKNRKRYLCSRKIHVEVKHGNAFSLDEVRNLIWQIDDAYTFDSNENDEWLGPEVLWASW